MAGSSLRRLAGFAPSILLGMVHRCLTSSYAWPCIGPTAYGHPIGISKIVAHITSKLPYAVKTKSALFCSHNAAFDWAFLSRGFHVTGVSHEMDYHRIDLFSVAWALLGKEGPHDLTQDYWRVAEVCLPDTIERVSTAIDL